jgi:hypothetical protein
MNAEPRRLVGTAKPSPNMADNSNHKVPQRTLFSALDPLVSVWAMRAATILLCAGCAWLVYWSLFCRLQPLNQQHQTRIGEMNRLTDEVQQLAWQQGPLVTEPIQAQYQAVLPLLVAESDDLFAWEKEIKQQANAAALDVSCLFGPKQPDPRAGQRLSFIPAELRIEPMVVEGLTNSAYQRLLYFTQAIANSPKRFQVVEFSIEGNSNSVQRAKAVLHLLAAGGSAS